MQKVYLAGGMRTPWRATIKEDCPGFIWADPQSKPEGSEDTARLTTEEYGAWNKHAIHTSSIVFAYMERENPSGIGLAIDIAYAKAQGKTVILVLEPHNEVILDRYLAGLKNVADVVFDNLDEGLAYLHLFSTNK